MEELEGNEPLIPLEEDAPMTVDTPGQLRVKLSDDKRAEFGRTLVTVIRDAENQRSSAEQWWADVERFHRNEPPSRTDKYGAEPDDSEYSLFHVPFSQPRQDALNAQVCTVVFKQDPYLVSLQSSGEIGNDIAGLVHSLWHAAGIEHQGRKAAYVVSDTNRAIWRVVPKLGTMQEGASFGQAGPANPVPGLQIDVIHPRDFVLWPATAAGIQGAQMAGHRFYASRGWIDARRESGYFDKEIQGVTAASGDETNYDALAWAGVDPSSGSRRQDDQVLLFDVIWDTDLGKGVRRYNLTVAYDTMEILRVQEYPFDLKGYFASGYKVGALGFWSESSVGRDLYPIQDAVNKLHSGLYVGTMMSAMPAMFGYTGDTGEKETRYRWGDVYETDQVPQMSQVNSKFDGNGFLAQLQIFDKVGDQIARISQNTLGGATNDSTATEASIIAASVQTGVEEYIANFTAEFPLMAWHTQDIASKYRAVFGKYYDLPEDPNELEIPVQYEINGKSPENTPSARRQSAQLLLGMSADPNLGIDGWEAAHTIIATMGLGSDQKLQRPKQETELDMIVQQMAAAGVPPELLTQIAEVAIEQVAGMANDAGDGGMPDGMAPQDGAAEGGFDPAAGAIPEAAGGNGPLVPGDGYV